MRFRCGYAEDSEVNDKAQLLAEKAADASGYLLNVVSPENGSPESYFSSTSIPSLRINMGSGEAPLSTSEFNSIWNSMREVPVSLCLDIMGK